MPSITSPVKYAGTATDTTGTGLWSNINNSKVLDNAVATFADGTGSAWTHGGGAGIALTNYGFAIPSNAIIDGIQVVVTHSGSLLNNPGVGLQNVTGAVGKSCNYSFTLTSYTLGGPTDLWGAPSITPAMLNSSSFGIGLGATNTHDPSDANYNVDAVSVIVYYHLGLVAVPNDVPIREVYKVYNAAGSYLGNLPLPTNPIKIAQDINSLGSQITLNVPVSADTSNKSTEAYTTEDLSQNYTTEDATGTYTTEGQVPIVVAGISPYDALIKNGNTVQVWFYNYWYPNGKCMFIGRMRRWEADFGGSGTDQVAVVCYSSGYDLDNYVTRGAPFAYSNDQSQLLQNANGNIFSVDKGGAFIRYGQTFTQGAGITNLGAITVMLNGSAEVTVNVYDMPNGGTLLGSSTQNVSVGSPTPVQFGFSSLIALNPGQQYFFEVLTLTGASITIYYQNTDVYAGGTAMQNSYGGSGGGGYGAIAGDLYFITGSGTPSTTATFTAVDPTTGMFAPIITDYNLRGGSQVWTVASVDATGLSLTYKFSVQTIYEAMQAILSLCPDGFYYYVDMGTQTIYFKNQSTVAEFLVQKGVHINSLKLITTTENSVNTLLFTGGDPGSGVNLYKLYQDAPSNAAFGPLLDRKTDNRVTLDATANAIGISTIAELAGEQEQTTITLVATNRLDITLLTPGKVLGFRGFGTFVDAILVQIVHREWQAESVTLTLGLLPTRLTYEYENTTRELIAEQTQDNPGTPT